MRSRQVMGQNPKYFKILQNQCKLGQIYSGSTMRDSLGENYDHIASNCDSYTLWV